MAQDGRATRTPTARTSEIHICPGPRPRGFYFLLKRKERKYEARTWTTRRPSSRSDYKQSNHRIRSNNYFLFRNKFFCFQIIFYIARTIINLFRNKIWASLLGQFRPNNIKSIVGDSVTPAAPNATATANARGSARGCVLTHRTAPTPAAYSAPLGLRGPLCGLHRHRPILCFLFFSPENSNNAFYFLFQRNILF